MKAKDRIGNRLQACRTALRLAVDERNVLTRYAGHSAEIGMACDNLRASIQRLEGEEVGLIFALDALRGGEQ